MTGGGESYLLPPIYPLGGNGSLPRSSAHDQRGSWDDRPTIGHITCHRLCADHNCRCGAVITAGPEATRGAVVKALECLRDQTNMCHGHVCLCTGAEASRGVSFDSCGGG